jgi:RNA polymerase sigma factor (sigma-70 family)
VDASIAQVVDVAPVAQSVARNADDLVVAAFDAHRDELFTFLARTVRDDAEAEDLLQETFLRLSREVRAGRVPEQLRAWLYRVAANVATSGFRRRAVVRRWLDRFGSAEGDPGIVESPEGRFIHRERSAEIARALTVIGTEARSALLLASQGFSGREIARALGKSENATRALMCRARIKVRAELERFEP